MLLTICKNCWLNLLLQIPTHCSLPPIPHARQKKQRLRLLQHSHLGSSPHVRWRLLVVDSPRKYQAIISSRSKITDPFFSLTQTNCNSIASSCHQTRTDRDTTFRYQSIKSPQTKTISQSLTFERNFPYSYYPDRNYRRPPNSLG